MVHRPLLSLTVVLAGLFAPGEAARAQSAACHRYRAELASLGSGGSRMLGAAHQQRAEIARMSGYYHSIGCSQGGFFFGPPPECSAIAQRLQALQANYGRLAKQSHDSGARRRQLIAAIQQACQPQREARLEVKPAREPVEKPRVEKPRRTRTDEEESRPRRSLSGDRLKPLVEKPRRASTDGGESRPRRSLGGGRLVCVRTCDGSFFPLSNAPDGRSGADKMCQALCPGAETAAYSMPSGEDTELTVRCLSRASPTRAWPRRSSSRRRSTRPAPARRTARPGRRCSPALRRCLGVNRGDIIVTVQKAEELSRPKIGLEAERGRNKNLKVGKPFDVETTGSVLAPGASRRGESVRDNRDPHTRRRCIDPDRQPRVGRHRTEGDRGCQGSRADRWSEARADGRPGWKAHGPHRRANHHPGAGAGSGGDAVSGRARRLRLVAQQARALPNASAAIHVAAVSQYDDQIVSAPALVRNRRPCFRSRHQSRGLLAQPAIQDATNRPAQDRGHPEQPELRQRPSAGEEGRTRAARRVH